MLIVYIINTPLGDANVIFDTDGALTYFTLGTSEHNVSDPEIGMHSRALRDLRRELDAYFAGTLQEFTVPIAPLGTVFQLCVWSALRRIPYGSTCTYGELARQINNPGAMRAVGGANGANPIWLIVPCHRVVRGDGLGGYAGGVDRKAWLLHHEATFARVTFPS